MKQIGSGRGECIADVDVLVVGGGFSGVAAACAAVDAGRTTALIEPRTYLGEERTAPLRMWMSPTEVTALETAFPHPALEALKSSHVMTDTEAHRTVQPDVVKIALEDALLSRHVKFLYQVKPIAWQRVDAQDLQIEVTGKFGRGYIRAKRVIDATVQGLFASITVGVQPRYAEQSSIRVWRTLDFIRVNTEALDPYQFALPSEWAVDCEARAGSQGEGHVWVTYAFDWQVDMTPTGRNRLEVDSRFASQRITKWLFQNHAAFSAARWVGSSDECWLPSLRRISSIAAGPGESAVIPAIRPFQAAEGIFVANGTADVDDMESQAIAQDIARLIDIGTAVGRAAVDWSRSKAPISVPDAKAAIQPAREVRQIDVLVVGGGTSGVPAAISAAESGCSTLLLEMNSALGGAGTVGGVDSYWYGRREGFNTRVTRRVAEEHRWMGIPEHQAKWNIEAKMFAWIQLARDAGVEVLLHGMLVDVFVTDGHTVTGALIATRDGLVEVHCKVVIDATGDADVVARAGGEYVYGSERESATMWFSMIPFTQPGQSRNNWTSTVDLDNVQDITRAIVSARRRWVGYDHSQYVAPRETRHMKGEVCLTLTQQLQLKQWDDVVCIAFSNHDIKGHSTSDWLRVGLIPPNLEIEIPYRALIPIQVDGVIVTGKAMSATHDGLPAIRMQADLENLGSACGVAASLCIQQEVAPRDVSIRSLQVKLVEQGMLPKSVLERSVQPTPLSEAEMLAWIEQLDDGMKLYDYSDMGFTEVRRVPIPFVMVCTAGESIIPLLRRELDNPQSPRRLTVAKALAWYGDHAATPILLDEIDTYLRGETLPFRDSKIRHTQASPDQGAMPDLAYLFHSLAMTRDPRSLSALRRGVEKLYVTMDNFKDNKSGIFHYVDSLCDIAEQLGDPACIPDLLRLRAMDLLQNRVFHGTSQPDYFEERLAYLEVVIGRALARCGSKQGSQILALYVEDSRSLLARHAYRELLDITGETHPRSTQVWLEWINQIGQLEPKPWCVERGKS